MPVGLGGSALLPVPRKKKTTSSTSLPEQHVDDADGTQQTSQVQCVITALLSTLR